MDNDSSYLNRLKDGQPAAYEMLVEQFEGPLFRFFLCDHHDYHLAQEQTADTFAQLVRSLSTMKGEEDKLAAFVYGVARHIRLRRWRELKERHQALEAALEVCDPQLTPFHQAAERDELEKALIAISSLEPGARDALLLRFVEGFSIDDVAEALQMPVGTVKSHIHRGCKRLKAVLSNSECQT
jgi:RNA polymerase sigma-70 factor (ECF subfamily)